MKGISLNKNSIRAWIMPFVCMIMIAASMGELSTCLAAIKSIYGISGTLTSSILTVRSIGAVVAAMVSDKYFEKFGIRRGVILAMVIGAVSYVIFGIAEGNIAKYYIASVINGIGYSFGAMMPASMLLKKWFNKSRGVALSIASTGTALCTVIGAPVMQSIIDTSGLKTAYFIRAVVMIATGLLVLLTIVDDPSKIGMEPIGGQMNSDSKIDYSGQGIKSKTTDFVMILMPIVTIMVGFTANPGTSHLTLNYTTNGIKAMAVAKALSIYGVVLIAAKILFGVLFDKLGGRKNLYFFSIIQIVSFTLIGLGMFNSGIGFMYLALMLQGLGAPIQLLGYPNWSAELVSAHDYPRLLKRSQTGYQIGGLVGSIIPGIICDITGSYGLFYIICAALALIYSVIVLVAYKKCNK